MKVRFSGSQDDCSVCHHLLIQAEHPTEPLELWSLRPFTDYSFPDHFSPWSQEILLRVPHPCSRFMTIASRAG